MKLIGNIVCTIAVLTQILLSVGLLAHAPDCSAAQPISASETANTLNTDCGCGHSHYSQISTEDLNHFEFTSSRPQHDCTCTPQKTYPYVLSDQITEQKPKEHFLDPGSIAFTQVDFLNDSLIHSDTNQSNAPPSASQTVYLPQHHARFTSIHLGVFLI